MSNEEQALPPSIEGRLSVPALVGWISELPEAALVEMDDEDSCVSGCALLLDSPGEDDRAAVRGNLRVGVGRVGSQRMGSVTWPTTRPSKADGFLAFGFKTRLERSIDDSAVAAGPSCDATRRQEQEGEGHEQ